MAFVFGWAAYGQWGDKPWYQKAGRIAAPIILLAIVALLVWGLFVGDPSSSPPATSITLLP